jgi:hypothetical protein
MKKLLVLANKVFIMNNESYFTSNFFHPVAVTNPLKLDSYANCPEKTI